MKTETTKSKCPFEIGQKVRHRGSGEPAVVTAINRYETSGRISISTGFHNDDINVAPDMIEAPARESMEYHKNAIMAALAKLEVLADINTGSP